MADEIRVNTIRMGEDIHKLRSMLENLKKQKNSMIGHVNEMNEKWQGEAKDAFASEFFQDCGSLEELCDTIEKMISEMEDAKRTYASVMDEVDGLIHGIRL